MLARKEAAFNEKRTLESQIERQSALIRQIESEMELLNRQSFDGNRPMDTASGDSLHELEDRLVQTEMQLTKCTGSLATLAEEIQGLEMDHYSLIVTRRRFENDALSLSKFNDVLQFHGTQRTKSLMHLSSSTASGAGNSVPHTPTLPMCISEALQRLDRSASAMSFARGVDAQPMRPPTAEAPTIHITYDSSQSMEHSSDGGISSQGGDPLHDHTNTNTSSSGGDSHSPPPPTTTTQCPIYEDDVSAVHSGGLTRASLVEFSAFFRQGVCECGQQRTA